jgi:demethylmenaquinone methyltransferase/2-methoxy-6-polyprenyl-1,4-benzoquinol methylase
MGYALRHVADLRAMFGEFFRTLRPAVVYASWRSRGQPSPRDALAARLSALCSPGRGRWVGRSRDTPQVMRYLWDSIEACVPPQSVVEQMRAAGFTDVSRNVVLGIFSEYVGSKPVETMKGEM